MYDNAHLRKLVHQLVRVRLGGRKVKEHFIDPFPAGILYNAVLIRNHLNSALHHSADHMLIKHGYTGYTEHLIVVA